MRGIFFRLIMTICFFFRFLEFNWTWTAEWENWSETENFLEWKLHLRQSKESNKIITILLKLFSRQNKFSKKKSCKLEFDGVSHKTFEICCFILITKNSKIMKIYKFLCWCEKNCKWVFNVEIRKQFFWREMAPFFAGWFKMFLFGSWKFVELGLFLGWLMKFWWIENSSFFWNNLIFVRKIFEVLIMDADFFKYWHSGSGPL
jgi:hypothetical protein